MAVYAIATPEMTPAEYAEWEQRVRETMAPTHDERLLEAWRNIYVNYGRHATLNESGYYSAAREDYAQHVSWEDFYNNLLEKGGGQLPLIGGAESRYLGVAAGEHPGRQLSQAYDWDLIDPSYGSYAAPRPGPGYGLATPPETDPWAVDQAQPIPYGPESRGGTGAEWVADSYRYERGGAGTGTGGFSIPTPTGGGGGGFRLPGGGGLSNLDFNFDLNLGAVGIPSLAGTLNDLFQGREALLSRNIQDLRTKGEAVVGSVRSAVPELGAAAEAAGGAFGRDIGTSFQAALQEAAAARGISPGTVAPFDARLAAESLQQQAGSLAAKTGFEDLMFGGFVPPQNLDFGTLGSLSLRQAQLQSEIQAGVAQSLQAQSMFAMMLPNLFDVSPA